MRVVLLLVMLQALATSAFAISPRMVTGAIDFRFAKNSVALSATERERFYLKLSELKAAGLCVLEYVVIVGHGDAPPRTGQIDKIGAERALHIRGLVLGTGIPPHVVQIEPSHEGSASLSIGLVELDIVGYWGEQGCELSYVSLLGEN